MADEYKILSAAVCDANVDELRRLVVDGANVNVRNELGETLFFAALHHSLNDDGSIDRAKRRALLGALIGLGADLNLLDEDNDSVLVILIFEQDAATLEYLLRHGADPNRGGNEIGETLYDLAEVDYEYETWFRLTGPALPTPLPEDKADADSWLRFLDRQAQALDQPRPEMLHILRRHGALSGSEISRTLGGDASARIIWRDDRWHLDKSVRAAI